MDKYDIEMAPIYSHLEKIRIEDAKKLSDHHWFNRTLTQVNDSLVRLGVFEGEFHWHSHPKEDEFFFVLEGSLEIEIKGQESVFLQEHEGITIPKGIFHRPIAKEKAVVLMVEQKTIVPRGD